MTKSYTKYYLVEQPANQFMQEVVRVGDLSFRMLMLMSYLCMEWGMRL